MDAGIFFLGPRAADCFGVLELGALVGNEQAVTLEARQEARRVEVRPGGGMRLIDLPVENPVPSIDEATGITERGRIARGALDPGEDR